MHIKTDHAYLSQACHSMFCIRGPSGKYCALPCLLHHSLSLPGATVQATVVPEEHQGVLSPLWVGPKHSQAKARKVKACRRGDLNPWGLGSEPERGRNKGWDPEAGAQNSRLWTGGDPARGKGLKSGKLEPQQSSYGQRAKQLRGARGSS